MQCIEKPCVCEIILQSFEFLDHSSSTGYCSGLHRTLIYHSQEFVVWKDRKAAVPALRTIYRAKDAKAVRKAFDDFNVAPWSQRYPTIAQSWHKSWAHVTQNRKPPNSSPAPPSSTTHLEGVLTSKPRQSSLHPVPWTVP
jgi:hypothetical protein